MSLTILLEVLLPSIMSSLARVDTSITGLKAFHSEISLSPTLDTSYNEPIAHHGPWTREPLGDGTRLEGGTQGLLIASSLVQLHIDKLFEDILLLL
jgi:hypothetical protein